jgi:phosphatidylethanolamine-binding protein (PEBP) family uncharacterized protein
VGETPPTRRRTRQALRPPPNKPQRARAQVQAPRARPRAKSPRLAHQTPRPPQAGGRTPGPRASEKDGWPALQWQGVPENTEELTLFAANLQPVNGKHFFDWALAGLDPSLSGIEAGRLPSGAIKGTNGYSICPPPGQGEPYVFTPARDSQGTKVGQGFDPDELRKRSSPRRGMRILAFSYVRGWALLMTACTCVQLNG